MSYSNAMAVHQIDPMASNKKPTTYENCIKVSLEIMIFRANLTSSYLSTLQSAQLKQSLHKIILYNYGYLMWGQG